MINDLIFKGEIELFQINKNYNIYRELLILLQIYNFRLIHNV
jgi:hypothetical protein